MAIFVFVGQDANNTANADTLVVNDDRPIDFTIDSGAEAFVGDDLNTGADESLDDTISYTDYDGNVYTGITFDITYVGVANWRTGGATADPAFTSRIAVILITSGPETGQTYTLILSNPPDPNQPNPNQGSPFGTFTNGNHRSTPTEDLIFCFAEGTLIATPDGEVAVESLLLGDLVATLDNGPQPIRWIGSTTVPTTGINRPIRIEADALGKGQPHRALIVSPAHRMLVDDTLASLLFDCPQMLAHAQDIVNDHSIRPDTGSQFVRYFHFMCDQHQLVWANGALAESFHPSQATSSASARASLDELERLFPEQFQGGKTTPSARPTLDAVEARLLATMRG